MRSDLYKRILEAKRKTWFGRREIFKPYQRIGEIELNAAEERLGTKFPFDLKDWLLTAGYGDLNEALSFRSEWFWVIDRGELRGHLFFAQDELGNYYSISAENGDVNFVRRSDPEYSPMAVDFRSFMEELERREFNLHAWINELVCRPYNWD